MRVYTRLSCVRRQRSTEYSEIVVEEGGEDCRASTYFKIFFSSGFGGSVAGTFWSVWFLCFVVLCVCVCFFFFSRSVFLYIFHRTEDIPFWWYPCLSVSVSVSVCALLFCYFVHDDKLVDCDHGLDFLAVSQ